MIVYSISSLLELAEKISNVSVSFPFLESFAGKYSQKVTEDRKIPLFSRTSKYNNFPVRCQWKGGSDRLNYLSDKRRERSSHNDKYNNNLDTWRTNDIVEKMDSTKIQKISGIKGLAIKVLNKITKNNFEKQSNELLKVLIENKEEKSVYIVASLVLDKIWYDKGFYGLYVNLCQKLWENSDWVSECYELHCVQNGTYKEYFYSLKFNENGSTLKGPFKTKVLAETEAKNESNFKSVFISLCRDNFYKRHIFIEEATLLPDSTKKYKLKRRLFGTVEILGYFYKMGFLDVDIIHFLLLSLLHTDNIHNSGAKYPDEIEALKLLWVIVNDKIGKDVMKEYSLLLKSELKKNWGSRLNFMIDDMLETINTDNETILNTRNFTIKNVSFWNSLEDIESEKSEIEDKPKNTDEIVDDVIQLSRIFTDYIKEDILEVYEGVNNLHKFSLDVITDILKDSTEYGEYSKNHVNTILSLLKNNSISELDFDKLSSAFTTVGEEVVELKIDAPKAPQNMSFVIGTLLDKTDTGDIVINLNLIDNEFVNLEDVKNEWYNILKLAEEFVSKDIISSRVTII